MLVRGNDPAYDLYHRGRPLLIDSPLVVVVSEVTKQSIIEYYMVGTWLSGLIMPFSRRYPSFIMYSIILKSDIKRCIRHMHKV